MNKIKINIPGHGSKTFDSYEKLDIIWELLENYNGCTLEVIEDKNENKEIITEAYTTIQDKSYLQYDIPKSVALTQRFQDRVRKEIPEILNSVYPNSFSIISISFEDKDKDNMIMSLGVKANNEDAKKYFEYIDSNIDIIVKDFIDYYKY